MKDLQPSALPEKQPVLGVPISVLRDYEQTFQICLEYARTKESCDYVTVNNVHTVAYALLHPEYKDLTKRAFLSLPDGMPLCRYLQKRRNISEVNRIFGPEFFEKALSLGVEKEVSHFFLGGSQDCLDRVVSKAKIENPGIRIAGHYSPPFGAMSKEECDKICSLINAADADFVWVAFGAPRQEYWMAKNFTSIRRGLLFGVGAAFNYYAGEHKRAPEWMQKNSMEWLYRLKQEPARLWSRYLIYNSLFVFALILEKLKLYRPK